MNKDDICLNIGCWLDVAEGWENIDSSPYVKISKIPGIGNLVLSAIGAPKFPAQIKYGDLLKGLDLRQGSCKLIFASHVLEHLSLPDFKVALNNFYSYLQPGGILRIIVPDLEQYINNYIEQRSDPVLSKNASNWFMEKTYLGYTGSRSTLYQRLREIFANSRHQWMWDEPSLSHALVEHNFKNIRRCNFGDWSDPRFESVENKKRHWNAICIEATK